MSAGASLRGLSLVMITASALLAAASTSAFLLALLDRARPHLNPLTLRASADLVLLTPALLLPFTGLPR